MYRYMYGKWKYTEKYPPHKDGEGKWSLKRVKTLERILAVSVISLFYEQGQLHHLHLIRQDQHIRQAVTRILTSNFVLIQLKKMDQHLCKSEVDIFI